MKFRKRPVVIEAVRWENDGDGGSLKEILALARNGRVTFAADGTADLVIETLEGDMRANVGDWIIRGVKHEIYPCKPDIFAATYEVADASPLVRTEPAEELWFTADEIKRAQELSVDPVLPLLMDGPLLQKVSAYLVGARAKSGDQGPLTRGGTQAAVGRLQSSAASPEVLSATAQEWQTIESLKDLLRASKREHYHCDDSWYCCKRCDHPDHDKQPGDIRPDDLCTCGADEWNKRVDAALDGWHRTETSATHKGTA